MKKMILSVAAGLMVIGAIAFTGNTSAKSTVKTNHACCNCSCPVCDGHCTDNACSCECKK